MLFSLHVFLVFLFLVFFLLVFDFNLMVLWLDMLLDMIISFLKFTKACFVALHMIYSGECGLGMLSHKSLKLSSLFSFFFLSTTLVGWISLPYSSFTDSFSPLHQAWCGTPLWSFSVQLLCFSVVWFFFGSFLYFHFEILALFMCCSSEFSEHLYDSYFELYQSLISISLRSLSRVLSCFLFRTHSSPYSFSLSLYVSFWH